jgi:mannose-1-phosphate guanylyltransferase
LANAGLYAARRDLLDEISDGDAADFGMDVLPRLVGRMHGWPLSDYLIDIGTPDNYRRAEREWSVDYH